MNSYNILIAIGCALVGVVYSSILTEPGMIFHGLYKWLELKLWNKCNYRIFEDSPKYKWIFKPLIDCYRCVSGQIALWVFSFLFFNKYILFFCSASIRSIFNLLGTHVFLICLSIFTSCLLNNLYQKIR